MMKKFIVQSSNWKQVVTIDDSVFEKREQMGFEAMTRAAENITQDGEKWMEFKRLWSDDSWIEDTNPDTMNDDYVADYKLTFNEEFVNDPFNFGEFMAAYPVGTREDDYDNKTMALSEFVLLNAGCPELAKKHFVYHRANPEEQDEN